MKIIFFGTPNFVLPIPQALIETGFDLVAVITNPDRPAGRDQILTPTPVKVWAEKNNIPVLAAEELNESFKLQVSSFKPDVAVLAAYGKIIPQEVIDLFPKGILVVHPSLLPKYRGASPIQAALVSGDSKIGCSIILMDRKMDHGSILSQFDLETNENSTSEDLFVQAFEKSAEVLKTLLPDWVEGKIEAKEQDHTQATFTTLLKKEHGFIPFEAIQASLEGKTIEKPWSIPFVKGSSIDHCPLTINNFIRALSPWPGCWTLIGIMPPKASLGSAGNHESGIMEEKRLKLLKSHVESSTINHQSSRLVIDEVQLEGKRPEPWEDFNKRLL